MTDQDFLEELQFALLESPDGGQSWPSEVFTREDVLDAVNTAARRLQRETHLTTTRLDQFIVPGSLSVSVPGDWLATVHLVWRSFPEEIRTPLTPVDGFEADGGLPGWEATRGTPLGWADLDTNTLEFRLVPTPDGQGNLEHLYIPVPPLITGDGSDLPIPEDFLSGLKYDTLQTLLRGVTRLEDPARAAYCEQRYSVTQIAADLLLKGGA